MALGEAVSDAAVDAESAKEETRDKDELGAAGEAVRVAAGDAGEEQAAAAVSKKPMATDRDACDLITPPAAAVL